MGPKTTKEHTTRNESTSPWGPAAQYFPDLYARGAAAVDATNSRPFGGDYFAMPTAAQREGVAGLKTVAPTLATGVPSLRNMADRIAGGEFLDVANNPLFRSAASAAVEPITHALQTSWLPAIEDQAIKSGAYGGGAQDTAQNLAIREASEAGARATTALAGDYYRTGAGMTPYAAPMYAAANELALKPSMTTGLAGTQEQQWNQTVLDNELAKYKGAQEAPWTGLRNFADLLTAGGFRNATGVTDKETTTPAPDMATMILQGGLGGLSLLSGGATALPGILSAGNMISSIFKPKLQPQPGTEWLL